MKDFTPDVFAWFVGLEADNSREYFSRTRDFFEEHVREALEELLHEIGEPVSVRRQHRDLRFSKDKSPYKTRTYGTAGRMYVGLSSSGLFAGTGYYRFEPEQLERYRAGVADDTTGPQLADAAAQAQRDGLEIHGESLKTAPRGYPKDHPRLELLRRKQLFFGAGLPPGDISGEQALQHARRVWTAAEPMVDWLDAHVA